MDDEPNLDELKKFWDAKGEKITLVILFLAAIGSIVCIILGICKWMDGAAALGKDDGNIDKMANLGSYLQGSTGSLWALAGFFVVFLAFLIQAVQLAEQRKQFKIQSDSVIQQNFETRFFELLGYHRQNVSEIGIGEKTGRRVFVSMIREFRESLDRVNEVCKEITPNYPRDKRLDMAYMAFYYGVGPNSTRVLREMLVSRHESQLTEVVIAKLEEVQKNYRYHIANPPNPKSEPPVHKHYKEYLQSLTRLSYCPFDGHQSRLGHYFRHLYQIVKYAAHHAPNENPNEYVDLIRAQLTNHEQALFCLNALSSIGSAWIKLGYLSDFELIKNIPKNFFDPVSEVDLEKQFPKIHFEYMTGTNSETEPNR